MITEFGKLLRKIRIDKNEYTKHMAGKLFLTESHLNQIELGKKSIPHWFLNQLNDEYKLTEEMKELLEDACNAHPAGKFIKQPITKIVSLETFRHSDCILVQLISGGYLVFRCYNFGKYEIISSDAGLEQIRSSKFPLVFFENNVDIEASKKEF